MFFLEVIIGQYTSEGGITCWEKICPLFSGEYVAGVTRVCMHWDCQIFLSGFFIFWVYQTLPISVPDPGQLMLSVTDTGEHGEGREIQQVPDYLESPLGVFVGVWMSELAAVLGCRSLEIWGSGLASFSLGWF